jgi:predicted nucleic acid-binding protein
VSTPAQICYLDTSVITTALVQSINHHSASLEYCRHAAAEAHTVCFSELLRLEYAHSLRVLPSQLDSATFRLHGLHRWDRQTVRERWYRRGWSQFDEFVNQFVRVIEVGLSRPILDSANHLMGSCNLGSYDAAHAATALAIGATELACVDSHFSRVNHLIAVRLIRDQPATAT